MTEMAGQFLEVNDSNRHHGYCNPKFELCGPYPSFLQSWTIECELVDIFFK